MLLCLILFLQLTSNIKTQKFLTQYNEEEVLQQRQTLFTKNFLKLYDGFSIIFHLENSTVRNINHLLKLVHSDSFGEIAICNHDTIDAFQFYNRKRSSFLHLVILTNREKYFDFIKYPKYLFSKDVVLFFVFEEKNWQNNKFWKDEKLSWAGNVVILTLIDSLTTLYNVCYFCGNLSKKLNYLETINISHSFTEKSQVLPRKFQNFDKHRFKVGYLNSFPHMLCERSNDIKIKHEVFRKCKIAVGMEVEILDLLSQKLNFSYWLIEYDQLFNQLQVDSVTLYSRKIDWMIGGISITSSRALSMSFTTPLAFEPYTFLYVPQQSYHTQFLSFLKPFQPILWVTLLLSTIGFSFSLYWMIKVFDESGQKGFSLRKCFAICFKIIIEQTEKVNMKSIRTRFSPYVILAVWWLTSQIIITAFKSKLWAISIKQTIIEPANLEQLLNGGYRIVVNTENSAIMEDILNDSDPLIVKAKRNLILKNRTCDALTYIFRKKSALLDEYGTIQYHTLITCAGMYKKSYYTKLRITKTPLRQATHAWPLRIGSPYKEVFDIYISRIHAAGLRSKWKSDCLSVLRNKYDAIRFSQMIGDESSEEKYFLKGFISAFTFYLVGNVFASICFLVEIIRNKNELKL